MPSDFQTPDYETEDAVWLDPSGNTFDHDDEPVVLEDLASGHGPRNEYQHQQDAASVHVTEHRVEDLDPVLVRVVESPPPRTMRRRFIAANIPARVDDGSAYGARRILPQRFNRTKTLITIKPLAGSGMQAADRVWVSQDESPGMANGWPLDDRETFETNTTEDVWVALDPAATTGALICVYAEFVTELPEHSPGDKRHSGTHRE